MKKEKEGELEGWKRAEKKKGAKEKRKEESDLVNCYQLLSPLNRFLLF